MKLTQKNIVNDFDRIYRRAINERSKILHSADLFEFIGIEMNRNSNKNTQYKNDASFLIIKLITIDTLSRCNIDDFSKNAGETYRAPDERILVTRVNTKALIQFSVNTISTTTRHVSSKMCSTFRQLVYRTPGSLRIKIFHDESDERSFNTRGRTNWHSHGCSATL